MSELLKPRPKVTANDVFMLEERWEHNESEAAATWRRGVVDWGRAQGPNDTSWRSQQEMWSPMGLSAGAARHGTT
eukprot:7141292-Prymnesium_polylepis.2